MEQTTKWVFDFSHSKIGFSIRHFGITETEGMFKIFSGNIFTEKDDFSDLQLEIYIDATSIDTNDVQRDTHLKSADFFETERYPEMEFKNSKVELIRSGRYKLHGDLTIKNITRPIVLDLEFAGLVPKDPFGNTKAGFQITGKINRKDWHINWNAALDHGGVAVSETVKISCPVQLLKVK